MGVIKALCFTAIEHKTTVSGEEVFTSNTEVDCACVVLSGTLRYFDMRLQRGRADQSTASRSLRGKTTICMQSGMSVMLKDAGSSSARPATVIEDAGLWLCELALCIHWQTVGVLQAAQNA